MLRIPGGDVDVELLEYHGCERHPGSARPCDYGTGHFCVFVTGIDALYEDLRASGVSFRSDGAVEMTAGAERRWEEPVRARPRRLRVRVPPAAASMSVEAIDVPERPADRPPLRTQYRQMALIRRFEERAAELFQQGVIVGTAHSCVGQEAIAVGAAGVMRPTDYLVGHHRSHGHLIAAGADLRRMMAEMFGKRTGYCKGLGGSMHIADLSLNILGCNGIVGAGLPHACGAALTAKLKGSEQAAVAFFGDGAAGQGAAHEAMNLAATWALPVVFICENNQFALSAGWREQRAVENLADRAAGYGMPGEIVDGNDVLAVEEAVARALERARAGDGPTFLEMKTFRRMQHSMRANLPDVRDPALVEEWEARDPLPRFERVLRETGEIDDDGLCGAVARGRARRRARDPDRARGRGRVDRRPAPRRARPPAELPGARGRDGANTRVRGGGARGARPRARGRPGCDRDRRGHRQGRRALPRDRGALRALRRRADPRHPADRERLRRLRDRRGAHRAAPGRRAPVLGLCRRRLRPDHESGGEAEIHDGRRTEHPARDPHGLRRGRPARGAALAEPGGAVRPHPRPPRRDALDAVRRQGPALGRDPRRRPGHLPRAEAPLLRRARAGAAGAVRDRARRRPRSRARERT